MTDTWYLATVQFGRVQTFLFEEPQLKSMIGANALLGETARGRLVPPSSATGGGQPEFAPIPGQAVADDLPDNLPLLAVRCGAALPPDVMPRVDELKQALQAAQPESGATVADDDPLDAARDLDAPDETLRHGILIRDAGKLHAVFERADQARNFLNLAARLAAARLPGIRLQRDLRELKKQQGKWIRRDKPLQLDEATAETLFDLPIFHVCSASGQGPAERVERNSDNLDERISQSVHEKRQRTKAFNTDRTWDVLGLMRRRLEEQLTAALGQSVEFPTEFNKIVVGEDGLLATIVADGNGIGSRSRAYRDSHNAGEDGESDHFAAHIAGEPFYHRMRVAVRTSLVRALVGVFGDRAAYPKVKDGDTITLPFRLMMLGGDDLVLVCDAAHAAPFLIRYCEELKAFPLDDTGPIGVGAGVAITKKKFPFHRAHDLAEQLAKSAKRLARESQSEDSESVVDWLATTEAWHGDVEEVRLRNATVRYRVNGEAETLLLSRKPYPVLGDKDSLQALWAAARQCTPRQAVKQTGGASESELERKRGEDADENDAARNQFKALADALRRGRRQADRVATNVAHNAPPTAQALRQYGVLHQVKRFGFSASPWLEHGPAAKVFSAALLDFLELYELSLKQRRASE